MNLNSLLPHDSNASQHAAAIALEKKWMKTGLLEGLNNEVERRGMAVLLENQAKQLVTEANQTGTGGSAEEWNGVALPLVRRIFAEIAAKDFVSVQPMNLPSGLVFFLDFKYGSKQGTTGTAGGNDFLTGQGRTSQADSVFGITDAGTGGTGITGGTAGTEGLYGAGRFGYTINDVTSSALAVITPASATTAITTGRYATGSVAASEAALNFDTEFIASTGSAIIRTLDVLTSDLPSADVNGVRAFNLVGDSDISAVYPQFTKLVTRAATNDTIRFVVRLASANVTVNNLKVVYHKAPTSTTRGDFEDSNAISSY